MIGEDAIVMVVCGDLLLVLWWCVVLMCCDGRMLYHRYI